jgi:murein DD-endopeptidase MepM/ murein hydrolase activator NlpD
MSHKSKFFDFPKRVVVISSDSIKSRRIGAFSRIRQQTGRLWCIFVSVFFWAKVGGFLNHLVDIKKMQKTNGELSVRLNQLAKTIEEFRNYFHALNYYDHFSKFEIEKIYTQNRNSGNNSSLDSDQYDKVLPVLADVERNLSLIGEAVNSRIRGIDGILATAFLNKKVDRLAYHQNLIHQQRLDLNQGIKYLGFLESFVNSMPLAKPLRDYHVSSNYGFRKDPFHQTNTMHNGIDLVSYSETEVMAPADGIVQVVKSSQDLGNYVVISHGNGITTKYAHLNQTFVKPGDKLQRGNVFGTQGNTGKSTNDHLHYEVSVDNVKQDPKLFMQMGEMLDLKTSKRSEF